MKKLIVTFFLTVVSLHLSVKLNVI